MYMKYKQSLQNEETRIGNSYSIPSSGRNASKSKTESINKHRRLQAEKYEINGDRSKIQNKPRTYGRQSGDHREEPDTPTKDVEVDGRPSTIAGLFYKGKMDLECPGTAKIVRIFTSSTFTDTKTERNSLMERVYPRLKQYCQEQGYEFQIVDMRWGVRDEATDDQMTTELCLRELELCQKLSTGPNFVTFLSHKYGYRAFPRLIESTEFDKLLRGVTDIESKNLLEKWFKKDDNAWPPTYVLHSISDHIPEFVSRDIDEKKAGKAQWWSENEKMQDTLTEAARKTLPPQDAHRYEISVTELEITKGILEAVNPLEHTFWFKRNFVDIGKQEPCYLLSRYTECVGDAKRVEEAQSLLKDLKDKKLASILKTNSVVSYNVHWNERGMDPEGCDEHWNYIDQLCVDFYDTVLSMIDKGIQRKNVDKQDSDVFVEVVEHVKFCQTKCRMFSGREDTLSKIKEYVKGSIHEPLVVYGESGSGKTSIMAAAARATWNWCDGKAVTIVRFIGTTLDSSSLIPLLQSLIKQIDICYNQEERQLPDTARHLIPRFHKSMKIPTDTQPLVLYLDSLDQFDLKDNVRQLEWLPKRLPPTVKIIVSTLPDELYDFYPKLKMMLKNEQCFLEVPQLPESDVEDIIKQWLTLAGRRLTDNQKQIVLGAFQKCPLPLFLKLSFDVACKWTSFMPPNETVLHDTVKNSIDALFARTEVLHGKILVSRALAYLSVSRNGLSDSELEDILSCDDDVLNDVYMYWTPPIRRLPPLLLVRIKTDLQQYLVNRGADNVQVSTWYHRQFHEKARERYCAEEGTVRSFHSNIADFFSGRWANGNSKDYVGKDGTKATSDRHVSAQPFMFGRYYNVRKINNLVYHRGLARQFTEIKDDCLFNLDFLLTKIKVAGLRQVLDDFTFADSCFPEEDRSQINLLANALRLSEKALRYDPDQLLAQLLNRFPEPEKLETFLTGYMESSVQYLEADRHFQVAPGGCLVHCLGGHTGSPTTLVLNSAGNIAVTGGEDRTVKTWDVESGRLLMSLDTPDEVERVHLCCNESIIVAVNYEKFLRGFHVQTGQRIWAMKVTEAPVVTCVLPKDDTGLYVFTKSRVIVANGSDGTCTDEYSVQDELAFEGFSSTDHPASFSNTHCTGVKNFIVIAGARRKEMVKFDVNKKKFFGKFTTNGDDQVTVQSITQDEKLVVTVIKDTVTFISTDDFTVIKTLDGLKCFNVTSVHLSPDENLLYYGSIRGLSTYNLLTETETSVLNNRSLMSDICTVDGVRYVSADRDYFLRVWDVSNAVPDAGSQIDRVGLEEERKIGQVELLDNPRYILLVSSGKKILVYDVVTKEVVRKIIMNVKIFVIPTEEMRLIIISLEAKKIKVFNLITGRLTLTFQGKPIRGKASVPVAHYHAYLRNKKELVAVTKGRKGLKVYDVETGKVKAMMNAGQQKELVEIRVNKSETTACVVAQGGLLVIFDLSEYKHIRTIDPGTWDNLGIKYNTYDKVSVTEDRNIIVVGEGKPPLREKETEGPTRPDNEMQMKYLLSLDVQGEREPLCMFDEEKYTTKGNASRRLNVYRTILLGGNRIAVSYLGGVIRVYDLRTGQVLSTVTGHRSDVRLDYVDGSPFVLSHSNNDEENSFRLWSSDDYQTVATFTFDTLVHHFLISQDTNYLITVHSSPTEVVTWKMRNSDLLSGPQQDYPVVFEDRILNMGVDFSSPTDEDIDKDDPDHDSGGLEEEDYFDDDCCIM